MFGNRVSVDNEKTAEGLAWGKRGQQVQLWKGFQVVKSLHYKDDCRCGRPSAEIDRDVLVIFIMNRQKEDSAEPKYKIILVGDSGVGKTSLFWRYLHKETFCEEPMTTIDFRYKTISLHDKEVRLCIWDTAGQEKFRSIVATYFKSCQGVVLVFDLTSPASWENIKEVWYEMAFRRAPKAKYLLLGNKKDLQGKVPLEAVQSWCAERSIYYIQTCAVIGQNVEQAFFTLAALIDASQPHFASSSFATNLVSTREGSDRSSAKAVLQGKRGTSFYLRRVREPPKERKEKCCK